jgi:hypothetical protein
VYTYYTQALSSAIAIHESKCGEVKIREPLLLLITRMDVASGVRLV